MGKFMTFEKTDVPIAEIIDNSKFKKSKIIYLDSDAECHNAFNHLHIDSGRLQQIPNPNIERQILYICGSSGSGKSFYTKLYLQQYEKQFPKNKIYMFSAVGEDESLKEVKIDYINLESIQDEDITAEDFKDSLVIFDDCEALGNKKIKKKVENILDSVITTGRHYNVYCVITRHNLYDGIATKKILNECSSVTFFMKTAGQRSVKYLLYNYFGLSNEQIDKIKKIKSRHITILKQYPKIVLANQDVYALVDDESSSSDSDPEINEYFNKMKVSTKKIKK